VGKPNILGPWNPKQKLLPSTPLEWLPANHQMFFLWRCPVATSPAARACGSTDQDSHVLKGCGGWIHVYNCEGTVDGNHQIIVEVGDSNQAAGQNHLFPMRKRIRINTGQQPEKLIADDGIQPRLSGGPAPRTLQPGAENNSLEVITNGRGGC
jgi:hypothetical protein